MAAVENVIVQGLFFVWLIQRLDGGWNEGFKGYVGTKCFNPGAVFALDAIVREFLISLLWFTLSNV